MEAAAGLQVLNDILISWCCWCLCSLQIMKSPWKTTCVGIHLECSRGFWCLYSRWADDSSCLCVAQLHIHIPISSTKSWAFHQIRLHSWSLLAGHDIWYVSKNFAVSQWFLSLFDSQFLNPELELSPTLLCHRPAGMKPTMWTKLRLLKMPRQESSLFLDEALSTVQAFLVWCSLLFLNVCHCRKSMRPVRLDGAQTRLNSSLCFVWGTETIWCEVRLLQSTACRLRSPCGH